MVRLCAFTYNVQAFEWTNTFLDEAVPLSSGSWSDITSIAVENGQLVLSGGAKLRNVDQFAGYADNIVLLQNNGLHIEIKYVYLSFQYYK